MKTFKFGDLISLRDIGHVLAINALMLCIIGWFPFIPMFFLLDWIGLDFEITVLISAVVAAITSITGTTLHFISDKLGEYDIVEKDGKR